MLQKFFRLDFILLSAVLVLFALGLVVLYGMLTPEGAVASLFVRQSVFVGIAMLVIILTSLMRYEQLKSYSTALYLFAIGLLILVLFIGVEINGTSGWINLGFANVQPAEIAKIFMIIFMAHFIASKRAVLGEITTIFVSFVMMSAVVGLILLQPDAGSAMVLVAIWLGMIIASGIKKRYIAGFLVVGCVVAALSWSVLAPYQKARITNFLHPENDPQNTGYNVIQSMIAVGNGGLTGQGVGYGTQSQLNFLPEKHTDFIFASYVEAFGFIGALFLLFLFLVLFVRFRAIALYAKDAFGYFLVVGITVLLFVHMTVNIGMNMSLLPVTGIPLPFVSYGGSAVLSMAWAIGIILSVYRSRKQVLMTHVQESY
jgi:rod shape determining protein RodA